MRSVVRAAAYLPRGAAGGVRVAATDEDAFTLGATAVERAWADQDPGSEPVVVYLLGEYPAVADWGFAALLGGTAEVVRHPGGSEELTRAVREVEESEGGPALVVMAELPERTESYGRDPSPSVGAGAITYLLEPTLRAKPFSFGSPDGIHSALELGFRAARTGENRLSPHAYVGDWEVAPGAGRSLNVELIRRSAARDVSAVSEGAYVPHARYLENLPSRWRFVADECDSCHELTFPQRGACRRCRRRDALTAIPLPRDGGQVLALTTIGKGGQPTEFDAQVESSGPYAVALVELAQGVRTTLQVTDASPGEIQVGDRVHTLLRRLYPMEGEWRYGRKAVPALEADAERVGR